ncbi:M28 family peptidase [Conexibacter sp. SYSU D00693]|uniref:M28 family peptidase n=1 Tax=Conexibacter sp. SYSU D00693 TaxID=2812560 RepID=UPI00196ACF8D|nr:M28 family peptidase [Conexibacter sp. SYSU D00693]
MLDPRLYRVALVPVLVAVLVAAFSLENRPRPIGTTLAPDAFQGPRATQTLDDLAEAFPQRAPGDAADEQLARRIARTLRDDLSGATVRLEQDRGRTVDGRRDLTTVVATRPGRPGPGIVVVAHRDAQGRGARAELSGTAAMLELARVTSEARLRRTITFVSTSGGSAGAAGAARLATRLSRSGTQAVLVLGDLAGERVRKPLVVGWSSGRGQAPLQIRRTVEAAVRAEARTEPGGPRAVTQWARLALPITPGEQGPLVEQGLPAVLVSVSGERGPEADAPLAEGRLETFGRAMLRAITALDNAPDLRDAPTAALVTQRKVLPAWAVRLLVGALLLPPLLVAVDGLARLRRRREPVGPYLRWVLLTAVPFAVTALMALLLGRTGLAGGAPPSAPPATGLDVDGTALGTMAALALVLALGFLALRPVLLRAAMAKPRGDELGAPGAAMAVLLVSCAVTVAVWVVNPHAAALLVPALHLWLFVLSPGLPLRGALGAGLVVLSLLPVLAVWAVNASALGLDLGQTAWLAVLLVAGGQLSVATWLLWSVVGACAVCALVVAARRPPPEPGTPDAVTVRGPLSYAGPGSLGGTDSALRR